MLLTILGLLFMLVSVSFKFISVPIVDQRFMLFFKYLFITGLAIVLLSPLHTTIQFIPLWLYGIWALHQYDLIAYEAPDELI